MEGKKKVSHSHLKWVTEKKKWVKAHYSIISNFQWPSVFYCYTRIYTNKAHPAAASGLLQVAVQLSQDYFEYNPIFTPKFNLFQLFLKLRLAKIKNTNLQC